LDCSSFGSPRAGSADGSASLKRRNEWPHPLTEDMTMRVVPKRDDRRLKLAIENLVCRSACLESAALSDS
jgi:hypothetical protein